MSAKWRLFRLGLNELVLMAKRLTGMTSPIWHQRQFHGGPNIVSLRKPRGELAGQNRMQICFHCNIPNESTISQMNHSSYHSSFIQHENHRIDKSVP